MINEHTFSVAGLPFSVSLPDGWDADELLPSFRPFRCGTCPGQKRLFRLAATTQPDAGSGEPAELLGESSNDMGRVRLLRSACGYRIELDNGFSGAVHVLASDPVFGSATAFLRPDGSSAGAALSSFIRILYSQAVLGHGGISLHASCVILDSRAYLFLGKSGTGKSTHARQWLEAFPGSHLLNDDNPVLRLNGDGVTAYGTPWSGKTPCYRNLAYPVAGIVRLHQAPANRFTPRTDAGAFVTLLPSCSVIRADEWLYGQLCDTLSAIACRVKVGELECLPDLPAARLCAGSLTD